MAKRIIGNPTTTPMPQSNLMQTDSTKADYVKGKEQFIDEITKNLPSQDVSFEKTVSGTTSEGVSISDFAIAPIKIKTTQPNVDMSIISYSLQSTNMTTITTDSNGEYELLPTEDMLRFEFYCYVDFTITYQQKVDVTVQVKQNTEDIAELEENIGDVASALEHIIEIQNQYIGGDDV